MAEFILIVGMTNLILGFAVAIFLEYRQRPATLNRLDVELVVNPAQSASGEDVKPIDSVDEESIETVSRDEEASTDGGDHSANTQDEPPLLSNDALADLFRDDDLPDVVDSGDELAEADSDAAGTGDGPEMPTTISNSVSPMSDIDEVEMVKSTEQGSLAADEPPLLSNDALADLFRDDDLPDVVDSGNEFAEADSDAAGTGEGPEMPTTISNSVSPMSDIDEVEMVKSTEQGSLAADEPPLLSNDALAELFCHENDSDIVDAEDVEEEDTIEPESRIVDLPGAAVPTEAAPAKISSEADIHNRAANEIDADPTRDLAALLENFNRILFNFQYHLKQIGKDLGGDLAKGSAEAVREVSGDLLGVIDEWLEEEQKTIEAIDRQAGNAPANEHVTTRIEEACLELTALATSISVTAMTLTEKAELETGQLLSQVNELLEAVEREQGRLDAIAAGETEVQVTVP